MDVRVTDVYKENLKERHENRDLIKGVSNYCTTVLFTNKYKYKFTYTSDNVCVGLQPQTGQIWVVDTIVAEQVSHRQCPQGITAIFFGLILHSGHIVPARICFNSCSIAV